MALQIVTKKRFITAVKKITAFLKQEWNISVAEDFVSLLNNKITLLASQPNIGVTTAVKIPGAYLLEKVTKIRSIIVLKKINWLL